MHRRRIGTSKVATPTEIINVNAIPVQRMTLCFNMTTRISNSSNEYFNTQLNKEPKKLFPLYTHVTWLGHSCEDSTFKRQQVTIVKKTDKKQGDKIKGQSEKKQTDLIFVLFPHDNCELVCFALYIQNTPTRTQERICTRRETRPQTEKQRETWSVFRGNIVVVISPAKSGATREQI